MSSQPPILIAGGGIAGLSLALGLARRGFGSHIVERRDAFSESGAGIQISPNGVRALDVLGIRAALEPLAGRPREILVYAGASGRILQRLPLGDWIEARHGARRPATAPTLRWALVGAAAVTTLTRLFALS